MIRTPDEILTAIRHDRWYLLLGKKIEKMVTIT